MISNRVSWCHCLKISCRQCSTTELKVFMTILNNVTVNLNCTDNYDVAKINWTQISNWSSPHTHDLHLLFPLVCISHKFSTASCQLGHISLDWNIGGRGRPLPTMIGTIACSELHNSSSINFSSENKQCCGSNINGCASELIKAGTTAKSRDTENHRLTLYSEL